MGETAFDRLLVRSLPCKQNACHSGESRVIRSPPTTSGIFRSMRWDLCRAPGYVTRARGLRNLEYVGVPAQKRVGSWARCSDTLVIGDRLSAVGCRLSAIGCLLSAVCCRLSAIGCRQSAIGCRQSAVGNRLSAVGCRQSAVGLCLSFLKQCAYFISKACVVRPNTCAAWPNAECRKPARPGRPRPAER